MCKSPSVYANNVIVSNRHCVLAQFAPLLSMSSSHAKSKCEALAFALLVVSTEKVVRHAKRVGCLRKQPKSTQKKKNRAKSTDFRGGEGWIRTTEVTDNRFTVCSLWPLGNLSIGAGDRNRTNNLLITNQLLCLLSYTSVFSCWCLGADSNHRHRDFQSLALPTELPRRLWRFEGESNP